MTGWIAETGPPVPRPRRWTRLPPRAYCQGDVYILWDNNNARGDWTLADGDLQTGQDLETACLVSLFTDKLATPDFTPTDGSSDHRGWWADPHTRSAARLELSGSWSARRKPATRWRSPRRYALDALQWLIDDGVAKEVVCNTS